MWSQVARRLLGILVVCGLLVCGVEAADNKKKAKTPASPASASPAVQPAPTPIPVESPQDHAMKAWIEKLDGTTWSLELRPSSAKQGGPQQDTVTFEGRRVVSKLLMGEGYGGSNFTLTVGGDGTATWETMQANTGGDIVFWRGEVRGDTMSGVLSKQPVQGSSMTFSFTGTKSSLGAPSSEATSSAPPPSPKAAPHPPSTPTVEPARHPSQS